MDYTKGKLDDLVETIIAGGASMFVSAVGVPPKRVVDRFHEAGVLVMNMVCYQPPYRSCGFYEIARWLRGGSPTSNADKISMDNGFYIRRSNSDNSRRLVTQSMSIKRVPLVSISFAPRVARLVVILVSTGASSCTECSLTLRR